MFFFLNRSTAKIIQQPWSRLPLTALSTIFFNWLAIVCALFMLMKLDSYYICWYTPTVPMYTFIMFINSICINCSYYMFFFNTCVYFVTFLFSFLSISKGRVELYAGIPHPHGGLAHTHSIAARWSRHCLFCRLRWPRRSQYRKVRIKAFTQIHCQTARIPNRCYGCIKKGSFL